MLKGILVVAAMAVASPAFTQEVRVINGDTEHVYGPSGQIRDNRALQEQNAHARAAEERRRIQRQRAEYDRRMQAIQDNYINELADIDQRRATMLENAQRRARQNSH